MRKRSNSAVFLALLTASVFCLVSCAALGPIPIPSKAELVGTWQHPSDDAKVILRADGSAAIDGIPGDALPGASASMAAAPLTLTGTWRFGDILGKVRSDGDPQFIVDLSKDPTSPVRAVLIEGEGKSLRFYWMVGDPDNDNNYVFSR
jgi:hypothetical protein